MTISIGPDQACPQAWELMPWVLQGTAPQEQSDWLHGHLEHCAACRAEFAQQRRLRLAMSLPTDLPLDPEAGLERLLGRLDAPDATASHARPGYWLVRALAAAVLIQAIGIGVLGAKLWTTGPAPTYRTLSQASAPAAPGSIRVVPDAAMTLSDWGALLHRLGLRVVDGPNQVGAYTLAPEHSAPADQQALQQLRAAHGIRLAEPVSDTP